MIKQNKKNIILNFSKILKKLCQIYIVNLNKLVSFDYFRQVKICGLQTSRMFIDLFGLDLLGKIKNQNKYRYNVIYIFSDKIKNIFYKIICSHIPINSITKYYKAANWSEREVWDLFGIFFWNHHDLRRILTDYGFNGFPLRKDFPVSGFYEVMFDKEKKIVNYTDISLTQENRLFDFSNAWKSKNYKTKKKYYKMIII